MRARDRDAKLRDLADDLVTLIEWLPQAHRNIVNFAGLGYPRQSYPDAVVAATGHSDPVATFATDVQAAERKFDREVREADENLELAVRALHSVQAFVLRHTITAPSPPTGGLIDCANAQCDRFMTGLPNDRPRLGRCARCYMHLKRYREDWPTKRVIITEGKTP